MIDRKARIVRRQPQTRMSGEAEASLHPLLKRLYENRGVCSSEELDYSLGRMSPPDALKDVASASGLLARVMAAGDAILIVGDYDVDGATATSLALLGLRAMGAENVSYLVPNRFRYGYGLTPGIAREALEQKPGLVITVDNGISSIEGAAVLAQANVPLIVTDHHLAGSELPFACAIVNPNQPGCDFPQKSLAGVGVMFYLLLALRQRLRNDHWFASKGREEPNLAEFLDLVALGTVADMVPLEYNNRILVEQGIRRIRHGRCRPGILALMEVAGRDIDRLDASDLGFAIGPRLNAAGRLEDISVGIECLLCDNPATAQQFAHALDEINKERKQVEQEMQEEALKIVSRIDISEAGAGCGLCLFQENWHQGVTGLVASRIKDRIGVPVVAFARADDGKLRGSARSVAGLHIRDLLESVSSRNPEMIDRFGGHAMAAGLTMGEECLEQFAREFMQLVQTHFDQYPHRREVLSDGELDSGDFDMEVAELLRTASPWGQKFPAPVFDGEFEVLSSRVLSERHLKMSLVNPAGGAPLDAIMFRLLEPGQPAPRLTRVRLAFQLQVNIFRGRRSLQLLVEHLETLEDH